ncbi:ribosomal RNA small subunit methyltransferase G [Clostridium aceticum]|uniref:Ribosomal RNA small subunit methyltransferase G n=1 Tax=Clostridium aceticum TaxID=84022 RepID=A0A0D8I7X8_9CLOT|nr:16S rRNA (guanine(527)-N(7))-methyltransferase RsmG [Clostridium aceticum]AKL97368.1 ribosomal RNA small subunit methyltransferase G [Clostridium aceticum]KJF26375.1 16S rRNA methyltransferase [Clostridium aceticum]
MTLATLLKEGSKELGIELSEKQIDQLLTYKDILLEWNKKMNLTAIEDEQEVIIKHFLDSISCIKVQQLKNNGKAIDVGTGAGFPGIPLKVIFPQLKVTLLDSLNKRINFLKEVCLQLELEDMEFVHGRAEDFGQDKGHREVYDYAVARAVAPLNILVEYCLPFVKVGGFFVCQKGKALDEELLEGKRAIEVLGGKVVDQQHITLPFSDITHSILVIEKIKQIPTKYPRKAGKPSKNPL